MTKLKITSNEVLQLKKDWREMDLRYRYAHARRELFNCFRSDVMPDLSGEYQLDTSFIFIVLIDFRSRNYNLRWAGGGDGGGGIAQVILINDSTIQE
ncbi:hypothetical protein V1478_002098 [Vespula squamosa]|uniref:Uncharacterized protein n=1 Tax=Vespula squamosa TaxID=30214 RepID=A0ABD2BZ07_VESSQ